MERIISELVGKKIEVNCGSGVAFAGENRGAESGVLKLDCDGKQLYIYIDLQKIIAVNEAPDATGRPGFIA